MDTIWASIILYIIYFFGLVIAVRILLMPLFRRDRLQGKHVMITGGSKGLGLALAREFVKRRCDVTVVARNQTDLLAALQDLVALGKNLPTPPKIQALSADTSSMDDLAKAFSVAADAAGPIEILICNAGLSIPGLFVNQQISDFEKQMEVNYLGTVRTIKCALPTMLARRQGHIVITTSVLSVLGFAGYSSYAPTKWALRGLADCLHNEVHICLFLLEKSGFSILFWLFFPLNRGGNFFFCIFYYAVTRDRRETQRRLPSRYRHPWVRYGEINQARAVQCSK